MKDKTIRELRNEIDALGKSRNMVIDRAIRKTSQINLKIIRLEEEVVKLQLPKLRAKPATV